MEQAGTAEAGSEAAGEIIGFDEYDNPILSTGSTGGGRGGGGGGGGGMSPEQANRFLGSGPQSPGVGDYGPIVATIPRLLKTSSPLAVKLDIQQELGGDVDPETFKMINDTIDQAWEASNVSSGATLPKQSDLGVQVGEWGTVDPTVAYTPDTFPEDVLPMLGEGYMTDLDRFQSDYDEAIEGWNRFLKANKGEDCSNVGAGEGVDVGGHRWRHRPQGV